jgi:hypothetical protein
MYTRELSPGAWKMPVISLNVRLGNARSTEIDGGAFELKPVPPEVLLLVELDVLEDVLLDVLVEVLEEVLLDVLEDVLLDVLEEVLEDVLLDVLEEVELVELVPPLIVPAEAVKVTRSSCEPSSRRSMRKV